MSGRKRVPNVSSKCLGTLVELKLIARYFGYLINTGRKAGTPHIKLAEDRFTKVIMSRTGLLPRLSSTPDEKRRILAAAVGTLILYVAEVWL